MKKLIVPLAIFALLSFTTVDSKLTDPERLLAMTELTVTHDHLLHSIYGLSEAQLNFKSSPDSWSIAECTEHIAISETNIFGMIQEALKTPVDPSKLSEVKLTDQQILAMIVDRTNKVKTPESFEPTGRYGSHNATVNEFKTNRIEHIKYVSTTQDELRDHYAETPLGIMDAYQILLFMSAHTERHVLQIKEVMSNENFPKK